MILQITIIYIISNNYTLIFKILPHILNIVQNKKLLINNNYYLKKI